MTVGGKMEKEDEGMEDVETFLWRRVIFFFWKKNEVRTLRKEESSGVEWCFLFLMMVSGGWKIIILFFQNYYDWILLFALRTRLPIYQLSFHGVVVEKHLHDVHYKFGSYWWSFAHNISTLTFFLVPIKPQSFLFSLKWISMSV